MNEGNLHYVHCFILSHGIKVGGGGGGGDGGGGEEVEEKEAEK